MTLAQLEEKDRSVWRRLKKKLKDDFSTKDTDDGQFYVRPRHLRKLLRKLRFEDSEIQRALFAQDTLREARHQEDPGRTEVVTPGQDPCIIIPSWACCP